MPHWNDSDAEDTELEATGLELGGSGSLLSEGQVFVIVENENGRRTIEIGDGVEMAVGRGEDCEISLDDTKASRRHLILRRAGAILTLQDLGSTNGTKLNGMRVGGGERRLVGGDVLLAGRTTFTVAATASTGVVPTERGRLELELERLDEATLAARLIRIALPESASPGEMEKLALALNRVAVVEERGERRLAALVEEDDAAALHGALQHAMPSARVSEARYPDQGQSVADLWLAATKGDTPYVPQGVCVADPSMVKVFRVAQRVAQTDTTVLITGETGAGKEVLAAQIHRISGRATKPYVRLNCASLPENLLSSELFGHERGAFTGADRRKIGYFEAANGGTLLLDEIGELSPSMQVKLLRVLESRTVLRLGGTTEIPIDVRVLCATHRDLPTEVKAGRFREDLYYRVSAFTLQVPPLRERPAEVGMLCELFLRQQAERAGRPTPTLSPEATTILRSHQWPGNVRELRNAIEHAFVLCDGDVVLPAHLPPALQEPDPASVLPSDRPSSTNVKDRLAAIEHASIAQALEEENGNQTRAAKRLGMSRRALIYKMEKYGFKKKP